MASSPKTIFFKTLPLQIYKNTPIYSIPSQETHPPSHTTVAPPNTCNNNNKTKSMETLKVDPLRLLLTSTGHKPTIITNRRNNTITFHQPSSLFPSGHLQVMCGHKFRHVVKAVGINGCDEGDGKRKVRGAVGATVVLACVIGAMCSTGPMCRPALAIWPFSTQPPETETKPVKRTPQEADATIKPVKPTLQVWMEQKRISNDNEITNAYSLLTHSLEQERVNIPNLKEAARKLSLSTDRKKALDALEKVQAKFHSSCQRYSADTCPLGLVAVEMLLLQGVHPQAEDELKKLMDVVKKNEDVKINEHILKSPANNSPLYADFVLFKAVISLMSNKKDARYWWEKYTKLYMPQDDTLPSFEDFEKQILKLLKNKGDELKKK